MSWADVATWAAVLAAGALLGGWAVARRARREGEDLAVVAGALAEGELDVRPGSRARRGLMAATAAALERLAGELQGRRIRDAERTALLERVTDGLDVALVVVDASGRVRWVNRAAARLARRSPGTCLGERLDELGLEALDRLAGEEPEEVTFPGGNGCWEVREAAVRVVGRPHRLLVAADVSRARREGERLGQGRLLRVLGHELVGSLAPITSLAESLRALVESEAPPQGWRDDLREGLEAIRSRAASLARFVRGYGRLAGIPEPRPVPLRVGELAARVAEVFRVPVAGGPDVVIHGDPTLLEQMLLNLLRNAVEAAGGAEAVTVRWSVRDGGVELEVVDGGPGPPRDEDVFVPFFTTKPGGTGIGLAISRIIAETHGGTLELAPRGDGTGAVARAWLPRRGPRAGGRWVEGR